MKLGVLSVKNIEYRFRQKQVLALVAAATLALCNAFIFAYNKTSGFSIHIYNMVWIFIFSSLLLYLIPRKKDADIYSYSIIGLSVALLSLTGRRQYIVNQLICYMLPLYFTGEKRKKTYALLAIFLIVTLIIVKFYARLRGGSHESDFLISVLNEFSMFDMLLVTDIDFSINGLGLFWGKNYLNIFTIPIPKLNIQPFDHMATGIVFNNLFHGAIPTSLFGSLYFNFSYIGTCLGAFLLGKVMLKALEKFSSDISYESIGYYSIFATFIYDIIRVGDIGRELWTYMTFLIVYSCFIYVMRKVRNDTMIFKDYAK